MMRFEFKAGDLVVTPRRIGRRYAYCLATYVGVLRPGYSVRRGNMTCRFVKGSDGRMWEEWS